MPESDLRQTLVEAAADIADEAGPDQITLRGIAARAGVSRQAPYLHFASKLELLAAVAAEAMRQERRWALVGYKRGKTPMQRMLALARAHLRLRRERPGCYFLAHGGVAKSTTEELQQEAIETFALLRTTVAELSPPGTDIGVVRQRCMIVWGLVRGVGELAGMASRPATVPGKPESWLRTGLEDLARAWQ